MCSNIYHHLITKHNLSMLSYSPSSWKNVLFIDSLFVFSSNFTHTFLFVIPFRSLSHFQSPSFSFTSMFVFLNGSFLTSGPPVSPLHHFHSSFFCNSYYILAFSLATKVKSCFPSPNVFHFLSPSKSLS